MRDIQRQELINILTDTHGKKRQVATIYNECVDEFNALTKAEKQSKEGQRLSQEIACLEKIYKSLVQLYNELETALEI